MRVELTPSEHQLAEKVILGLERSGRRGPVSRSLVLLAGLGQVAMGIWLLSVLASPKVQALPVMGISGPDDGTVTYGSLRSILSMHSNMTLLQVGIFTMSLAAVVAGTSVAGAAMLFWGRVRRDALHAKILRAALQQDGK